MTLEIETGYRWKRCRATAFQVDIKEEQLREVLSPSMPFPTGTSTTCLCVYTAGHARVHCWSAWSCTCTLLVSVVARTRMLANKIHPQSSQLITTLCSREMRKSITKSIEKSITKSITKSIEKSITKSIEKSPTVLKNRLLC